MGSYSGGSLGPLWLLPCLPPHLPVPPSLVPLVLTKCPSFFCSHCPRLLHVSPSSLSFLPRFAAVGWPLAPFLELDTSPGPTSSPSSPLRLCPPPTPILPRVGWLAEGALSFPGFPRAFFPLGSSRAVAFSPQVHGLRQLLYHSRALAPLYPCFPGLTIVCVALRWVPCSPPALRPCLTCVFCAVFSCRLLVTCGRLLAPFCW